jgi:hypothetical protein
MIPSEEQVRGIEAYACDRYLRGACVPPIDESDAVRQLDAYYSGRGPHLSATCGYVGILWFEVSFLEDENQAACLERARMWLLRARELCKKPWEAIEERLTDIEPMLDA